ncbi:putative Glycosyltransferase family 4 protein [Candidatus Magnetomoraceae bacterium gMMP-15]
MKIAFISSYKNRKMGGEARVFFELVEVCVQQYETAAIHSGNKPGFIASDIKNLSVYNFKAVGPDNFLAVSTIKNIKSLFKFLNDFSPDILHLQDAGTGSFISQIWAKMNDIPVCFTTHAIYSNFLQFMELNSLPKYLKFLLNIVMRKYLKTIFNNSDFVISLNDISYRDTIKFGFPAENIHVIPNGRNLSKYSSCTPTDITKKNYILNFIGFISDRKNQKFLLKVLKLLPENYTLNLVGDIRVKKYKKELDKYIEKNGLKNVRFKGYIPNSKIIKILEDTHIFVSASKKEVQSLVIIEALASGTPVVGVSNETINEFINKNNGFRLPENSTPEKFAKTILKISDLSQTAYDKLCQNAKNTVSCLDWSNILAQNIIVYQKYINKSLQKRDKQNLGLLLTLTKISKPTLFIFLILILVSPLLFIINIDR